jgi:hypothetical protein
VADFVNFNKRDVSLPAGCKDLMDVLHQKMESAEPLAGPDKVRHTIVRGTLASFESNVLGALKSPSPYLYLSISPPSKSLQFVLQRQPVVGMLARVQVKMGSPTEMELRRFLEARGFRTPDQSVPKFFSPNLPVEMSCDISSAVDDPSRMIKLVTELFREVCRLGDSEELTFVICERDD